MIEKNSNPGILNGMTLRDYFAGQALTNTNSSADIQEHVNTIVERAYRIADRMLVVRNK